jgi:hypothetical protein
MVVKSFSITLSRFEGTSELPGLHTIRESTQVRVAFRLLGLALIVLCVKRLIELARTFSLASLNFIRWSRFLDPLP